MLLRGNSSFFLWCAPGEMNEELPLVHGVYGAAHQFREFLLHGTPVTFEVPEAEGPVVSALRLRDRLLVRRSDFSGSGTPATLSIERT